MDLPQIVCAACAASYRHPGRAGKTKCRKCGGEIVVTLPDTASAPSAPKAPTAAPRAPVARVGTPPKPPSAKPAIPVRPTAPTAAPKPAVVARAGALVRPGARPSPKAAVGGDRPAPIKPKGMNPAVLWGSVGGLSVAVIAVIAFFVMQSKDKVDPNPVGTSGASKTAAAPKNAGLGELPPPPDSTTPKTETNAPAVDASPSATGTPPPATDAPKGEESPAATDAPVEPPPKKVTLKFMELVKQEPVEGTTPEEKASIEQDIATMLDPRETVGANKASRRLAQVGKKAIPFLLNQLMDMDMNDGANARVANSVGMLLRNITGMSYDMSLDVDEKGGEDRRITREFWFKWWIKNKAKWNGKDTSDE